MGTWDMYTFTESLMKTYKTLKKTELKWIYQGWQELRCFLPNGLPNYIMGKCLFGTDASFELLAAESFQAAYGEQWENCLSYLSSLFPIYVTVIITTEKETAQIHR